MYQKIKTVLQLRPCARVTESTPSHLRNRPPPEPHPTAASPTFVLHLRKLWKKKNAVPLYVETLRTKRECVHVLFRVFRSDPVLEGD